MDEDHLSESAFFYNYSAMNIGLLLRFIFSGFMDLKDNYEKIFEISNLINIVSIFLILKSWKYFDNKNRYIKDTLLSNLKLNKNGIISVICIIPILLICNCSLS
jgi:dipeptide/tripeptide permease